MKTLLRFVLSMAVLMAAQTAFAIDFKSNISIKTPGNAAMTYKLEERHFEHGVYLDCRTATLPVSILYSQTTQGYDNVITVTIKSNIDKVFFNIDFEVETPFDSDDCEFYMPGFWYHKNLRSPDGAPNYRISKSWSVRDDRLSTPLAGIFDTKTGESMSVLHTMNGSKDALTTHSTGEVILSGKTTLGYVGFNSDDSKAKLEFGFPYKETPKRYIRKLTLIDPIKTFMPLYGGETVTLTWRIHKEKTADFGEFVSKTWEYSFDRQMPQPLKDALTGDEVKADLCGYFENSFVDKYPLKYNSGMTLRCDDCKPVPEIQLGFVGRVLLNAFNQLEYGEKNDKPELVANGKAIFDSWQNIGWTPAGYLYDDVRYYDTTELPTNPIHSIRQQSEGIYAVLHYLKYEKSKGRKHPEWENKVRKELDNLLALQKADGHFPRKFHEDGSDFDASGGSTPSATSSLVMGHKYFGDKRYLEAAKKTVEYIEREIISKSDYFSSSLDANCEDKEAAIAAVTATYYLARVTKGDEQQHYINLCHKAAYFALSWYYLWDVPFAEGQMLGDLGFKNRGWSNVSVENNHVDVFVFEFGHILNWLGEILNEPRFCKMYYVIRSSLCQLMPTEDRLCGVAKPGFYPEVVQHTNWDYGKNGKGFFNDIFAPGWTIASLWELYSPTRTDNFLLKK